MHASQGTLSIGPVGSDSPKPQTDYLLKAITSAPLLNATAVDANKLFGLQLQKLAINALINPLTVIFRCKNGELANNANPHHALIKKLQAALIAEISAVFLALEQIQGASEETKKMFGTEGIRRVVDDAIWVTRENRSSMLQDVEAGRETEVRWISGWVVEKGKELGVECKVNARVVELIGRGFPKEEEDLERLFQGLWQL